MISVSTSVQKKSIGLPKKAIMPIACHSVVTGDGPFADRYVEFAKNTRQPDVLPPGMVYMRLDAFFLVDDMAGRTDDVLFIAAQEGTAFLLGYLSETKPFAKNVEQIIRGNYETVYGLKTKPGRIPIDYIIAAGVGLLTPKLRNWRAQRIRLQTSDLDRIIRNIPGGMRDLRSCAPDLAKEIAALRIRRSARRRRSR